MELKVKKVRYAIVYLTNKGICFGQGHLTPLRQYYQWMKLIVGFPASHKSSSLFDAFAILIIIVILPIKHTLDILLLFAEEENYQSIVLQWHDGDDNVVVYQNRTLHLCFPVSELFQ